MKPRRLQASEASALIAPSLPLIHRQHGIARTTERA